MVDVKIPWEALLSVYMIVGDYGWLNSTNDFLMGTSTLLLWYIPIVSVSAAEDSTFRAVHHSVSMGLLGFGIGFDFPVVILLLK